MGPEINNFQQNINRSIIPSEQLNLTTNNSNRIINKVSKRLLLIVVVVIIIIIFSVVMFFFKKEYVGSGKKEDLVQFMKLYQYGDGNEKKDISLNFPSNYTYAYKILDNPSSNEDLYTYAENLYKSYLKYSNKRPVVDYLLLYKGYAQMWTNVINIKNKFISEGEESAKKQSESYFNELNNIKLSNIKEKTERIEKVFENYIKYYQLLKKSGCIENHSINNDCEVQKRNDGDNNLELYNIYSELSDQADDISNDYKVFSIDLNNILVEEYKTKVLSKEMKK